ncbi:MAG: DUF5683 domain-containing protein [Bacteroidota bacterium]
MKSNSRKHARSFLTNYKGLAIFFLPLMTFLMTSSSRAGNLMALRRHDAVVPVLAQTVLRGGDQFRQKNWWFSARLSSGYPYGASPWLMDSEKPMLTGNVRVDLERVNASQPLLGTLYRTNGAFPFGGPGDSIENFQRRSPWAAAGLSALLPGAGQLYNHDYWKTAVFLTAEVAAWTGYFIYTAKGNQRTTEFQNYADKYWSVVEYANWINANGKTYNPDVPYIPINSNANLAPWDRVDWVLLNAAERAVGERFGVFTHILPPHGEQQYYELIGKYPQYNPGWDDADRSHVSDDNVSPHFRFYSNMRGEANHLYAIASASAAIVIVNHILSMAEAAWSASRHNRIHAELGLNVEQVYGEVIYSPGLTIQVRF